MKEQIGGRFYFLCRDRFPNGPFGERTLQKGDSPLFFFTPGKR
jgi:hypothetical protein